MTQTYNCQIHTVWIFFFGWRCAPTGAMTSSILRFLDHTQRPTTVGRTPLDEWSARRRDLYLTTHNNHNRQTPMPPVGFEPTIPASEWPQIYAFDRSTTETAHRLGLEYTNYMILLGLIQMEIIIYLGRFRVRKQTEYLEWNIII